MKAAVLYEAQTPLVKELDIGEPGPGQVMVKMMAGVCHSDWHVVKGEWTHLGRLSSARRGGHRRGRGPRREQRQARRPCRPGLAWAALRDVPARMARALLPDRESEVAWAAIPIDKDIPFPQASLIGCGVTTGVGAAINTAQVEPGTTAAVFGAGGVGLNVIQGCRIAGATTIIAVDLLDNKLDMAREFGATHTVNAGEEDAVEAIKSLTDGYGVHYAFEAIGLVEKPFLQSIHCTRNRGMSIWVGHAPHGTPVTIDARDLMMEKSVMGSLYGSGQPLVTFPRLLNLYKSGELMLDELVSRTYPVERINDAFEALGKGEVARSTLSFD